MGTRLVQDVIDTIAETAKDRRAFAKGVVDRARSRWLDLNWVIVHGAHTTEFYRDQYRRSKSFKARFEVGYELYYFVGGSFHVTGSIAPDSFALAGTFVDTEEGGKLIHFVHDSQL